MAVSKADESVCPRGKLYATKIYRAPVVCQELGAAAVNTIHSVSWSFHAHGETITLDHNHPLNA